MHGKKSLLTAVLAVLLAVSLLVPAAWASSRRRSGLVRPKFTVLYDFGLRADDPLEPEDGAVIAQGRDGNFYTTTVVGGPTT